MWSLQSNIIEPYLVLRQSLAPLKLTRWQLIKLFVKGAISQISTATIVLVAVFSLLVVIHWATSGRQVVLPRELPVVRAPKGKKDDFFNIIAEGRKKYPDTPYVAVNKRLKYVIVPARCFDELKRLPHHTASLQGYLHKVNFGFWSRVGHESGALLKAIAADLTRAAPARVIARQQDCRTAFESAIGYTPEWKPVEMLMTTFEVVTKVNACSFVGRDLGLTKDWTRAIMRAPLFVMAAVFIVTACPPLLRPLLATLAFLPNMKNQWNMKRLLMPILEEDVKTYQETSDKAELLRPKQNGKIPITAMLLSRYKPEEFSLKQLVLDYILLSFDSTPTTSVTLFHAICELAAHPEVAEVLRKELDEVMEDGKLPATHLQELKYMDSFMRESFRMHPISIFSLQRVSKQPVKFSVGPMLPPETMMCVDAAAINTSPDLWENPEKFDSTRFLDLRQRPGNENRYHFVTTASDSPGWGDGPQGCPGRFFATSTIKIALAYILQHYDIKLREGDSLPESIPLPNGSWSPDRKAVVMFKSRD